MVQGSREWLEWRRQGIGGSDIPAILGVCKYNTPYGVWLEKTGRAGERSATWATEYGKETEGRARSRYELKTMRDMPPAEMAHPVWPILRVSLDGANVDEKRLLEIKCPGIESHAQAVSGIVPPQYWPQVQYQLAVTGFDLLDYFSFYEKVGSELPVDAMIEVVPDIRYQGEICQAALDFWKYHVVADVPPPLTDRDFKNAEDNPEVCKLCDALSQYGEQMPKKEIDQIKAEIVRLAGHPKVRCGVFQISTVNRNGKFSYHKLTVQRSV